MSALRPGTAPPPSSSAELAVANESLNTATSGQKKPATPDEIGKMLVITPGGLIQNVGNVIRTEVPLTGHASPRPIATCRVNAPSQVVSLHTADNACEERAVRVRVVSADCFAAMPGIGWRHSMLSPVVLLKLPT